MASRNALKLQQCPLGSGIPECWKLVPDRALTLLPDAAGVIRVSRGRVWATLEGPHHGPANDWGDVVLRSGEHLQLLAGQQVVVEVYGQAVNEAAYFSWEPAHPSPAQDGFSASPWGDPLARPVAQAGNPLSRLARPVVQAMVRIGNGLQWLVQGRGRALSPMEFNQP